MIPLEIKIDGEIKTFWFDDVEHQLIQDYLAGKIVPKRTYPEPKVTLDEADKYPKSTS